MTMLGEVIDYIVDQEAVVDTSRTRRMPAWTDAEDQFLKENLGFISEDEIAHRLGRSKGAVHIRWTRELELYAPSKHPDYFTTNIIAELLGVDSHGPPTWVDRGLLPGVKLPFERVIRRVKRSDFYRWVVNPMNWIYFKHEKVKDVKLKRLLELRRERWGDEWWPTVKVAKYHGVTTKHVTTQIKRGKIPAVQAINPAGRNPNGRWNFWYVLRSEALRAVFKRGKGHDIREWSRDCDAFLVLARAVGISSNAFVCMVPGWKTQTVSYRLKKLWEKSEIPELVKEYGLGVQIDVGRGLLLGDWRAYRKRFPYLARCVRRFMVGEAKKDELHPVRGVLKVWCRWYFGDDDPMTKRLYSRAPVTTLNDARWKIIDELGENVLFF